MAVNEVNGRERALTLMEVVIVVGIIAILASILIPALQNATAKAREAKCRANLGQLSIGLQIYTVERWK